MIDPASKQRSKRPGNDEHLPRPPDYSDEALALRFSAQYGADWRYVAGFGRWYWWDGTRWVLDETLKVFDLARLVCREASAETVKDSLGRAVASAKTVAAVELLAKADRRHAAPIDLWDANPLLLNTPGGIIDLKTEEMRPHRREDYCTKVTAVAPGGRCPIWHKFLDRVTGGDAELQEYLKQVAGYALTGNISEHCLFFLYGTGRNGKTTFIRALSDIAGSYAAVAPMETFVATRNEQHPTELAGLRGARLVTANETEEGRRWAESRIKALTGGDRITARFMRQDFFTFTPQFKLLIAGNHRPGLRNVDEAIRRRFHLIPFNQIISEDEQDPALPEKLKAEWPGILAWMIEGAVEWGMMGLRVPEAVQRATQDYLSAEDLLERWVQERCALDPNLTMTTRDLYADWQKWCEEAGEHPGSMKRFVQRLESRNLKIERWHHPTNRRAGFRGIQVARATEPHWSDR